ncbi:hypothetical protein [Streptomyces sioyaensis]|uniref:hypothetical protein n=1 Tax=Streptomyces sioyaensis TaxID=67364 RepID=UPI003EBF5285
MTNPDEKSSQPAEVVVTDHGLSNTFLDLDADAFNPEAAKEIRKLSKPLEEGLEALLARIATMVSEGQLIQPEFKDEVPEGWEDSPGSPTYPTKKALVALSALLRGTPCTEGFERSEFRYMSNGRFCCDHKPKPHCYP